MNLPKHTKKRKPSRLKRISKFLLVALVPVVVVAGIWAAINYRSPAGDGEPVVEPSAKLTLFVGPLDENGDVNFIEAVNDYFSEGVTPDNNALNKFLETLDSSGLEGLRNQFLERVGFDQTNLVKNGLRNFREWLDQETQKDAGEIKKAMRSFEFARVSPWPAGQFQDLERWRVSNEKALAVFVQGLQRERYFHPMVSNFDGPAIMGANLDVVLRIRDAGMFIEVTAMRNLARGDSAQSIVDARNVLRLASLLSQGTSTVEHQFANEFSENAYRIMATICSRKSTSAEQLKAILESFDSMKPPHSTLAESLNVSSRTLVLESFIQSHRPNSPDPLPPFLRMFSEPDESLRVINHWFDEAVETARIEDDKTRTRKIEGMIGDLQELERKVANTRQMASTIRYGRKAAGKTLGQIFLVNMAPNFHGANIKELRVNAAFQLMQMVAVAELYKRKMGSYPQTIDEMKKMVTPFPKDAFSNNDYIWRVQNGILIVKCTSLNLEFSSRPISWAAYHAQFKKDASEYTVQELLDMNEKNKKRSP